MDFEELAKSIMKYGTDAEYGIAKSAWDTATKAEREACAVVCDDLHHAWRFGDGDDSVSGPKECASTIRMRSNV